MSDFLRHQREKAGTAPEHRFPTCGETFLCRTAIEYRKREYELPIYQASSRLVVPFRNVWQMRLLLAQYLGSIINIIKKQATPRGRARRERGTLRTFVTEGHNYTLTNERQDGWEIKMPVCAQEYCEGSTSIYSDDMPHATFPGQIKLEHFDVNFPATRMSSNGFIPPVLTMSSFAGNPPYAYTALEATRRLSVVSPNHESTTTFAKPYESRPEADSIRFIFDFESPVKDQRMPTACRTCAKGKVRCTFPPKEQVCSRCKKLRRECVRQDKV
ncbi:hypothetical protein PSPO01_16680 [Paraphaeosphaeria sporulosa]